MKTLILPVFAALTCSAFIFASQSFSPKDKTAFERVSDYKKQNSISCAPQYRLQKASGYLRSYASLMYWSISADTSHNTLFIPDTLVGTHFTLRMHDTAKQYLHGVATATAAFNNNSILGPTLIFNKGTTVHMYVRNELADSTTVHWHGMHLPAVMDGGPHQVIAPGTVWTPIWIVKNNAATYWYHPHLHMKTTEQIMQGLTGMIIVRDEAESALNLPRTYGVDDIPLILNDKRFDALTNQFVVSFFGDTMMCNGTMNAQYNVPAQVVRFRIVNAHPTRDYNLGFSDNRSFSVIAGDAGLLNSPVPVTRYVLSPGERIEILVNFSGESQQTRTLRAFNSSLPGLDIAGAKSNDESSSDLVRNNLAARDFDILQLNIVSPTAGALTFIPSSLITNDDIDSTQASIVRTIRLDQPDTCPNPPNACFQFNQQFFDMNRIDYKVKQDAIEIWEITNRSGLAHPFHIHDVSFKILSKSNEPVPEYEKGWKDVVLIRKGSTVRFIAKFSDYADSIHPFMFHCHITFHEDEGMMGQFVVTPPEGTLPSISISNSSIKEGNSGIMQMNFTVTLSSPYTQAVMVNYKTKDITAAAPSDYTAVNGTLTFNAGETIKTISVGIIGDVLPETDETFKVTLSNPVNASIAVGSGKGKITNDDFGAIAAGAIENSIKVNNGIKIFPNPVTNGLVNISISPAYTEPLQLKLFDAAGNIVIIKIIAANTTAYRADVSNLKDGIYLLLLSNNGAPVYKQKVQVLNNR
ncbi:MAG TPA: multicopper oxidase domain-containing protein [Chitinophagaceae bacterium]|nr:multicopper oxidase domain-containing protein [Chitinophagaceae bacterium]